MVRINAYIGIYSDEVELWVEVNPKIFDFDEL
jgi:hypothetical protein